jgi:hypothetical protein
MPFNDRITEAKRSNDFHWLMSKFMEETVITNYNIKHHNYWGILCLLMTELQRLNEVMTATVIDGNKANYSGFGLTAPRRC